MPQELVTPAPVDAYHVQIQKFESGLVGFLEQQGLPSTGIFVDVDERLTVFQNLSRVIRLVPQDDLGESTYISKFIASTATGLFDAALNYLWDETILQIRRRVKQYDIEYFYDNAVSGDRRSRLKGEDDLPKLDDYDLISGAKEIGLISELGFKHLQYINYLRNWASAAHPNQNEISGLQLVTWMETCVKEVIALPISTTTVKIKSLLVGIKRTSISDDDAREIGTLFTDLAQDQVNNLAAGFFGIYTKPDTDSQARQNINKLLPLLWPRVDEETRYTFGSKYSHFIANAQQEEKKLAREFLQVVDAESYISDDIRASEIDSVLTSLSGAHRAFNNFYNEPGPAIQLKRLVGNPPRVPRSVAQRYVLTLVEVYLSNGHGIADNASQIYEELIAGFNSYEASLAVISFKETTIASKLQFDLCQGPFKKLIELVKPSVTSPPVRDIIERVEGYTGKLENMRYHRPIETALAAISKLIN
ncbi:MAG TPA: hypothetical protein PLV70_06035 [Flavobacteriales bacterium]|nr:hypothetical protein [Flavobacteriales bacterium]